MKIFPSLASADPMNLGESIRRLEGYPYLHLDIEDGNFVPNITFGMKTVRAAASICTAKIDAHLMVTNPEDYLEELAAAGVEAAAFHIEATGYPLRLINRIHQLLSDPAAVSGTGGIYPPYEFRAGQGAGGISGAYSE